MPRSAKFFLIIAILLMIAPVHAQSQTAYPPQLLYRNTSQLYLADAETGVSQPLAGIETSDSDIWKWSPNGGYLLGLIHSSNSTILKIYDVDQATFLDNLPIIEATLNGLYDAAWSPDSEQVSYALNSSETGQLWTVKISTGQQSMLYQSPSDSSDFSTGVGEQWWSPSGDRLLFEDIDQVTGGGLFNLYVTDFKNRIRLSIGIPARFQASYIPLWSPDGRWILLDLKETSYKPPRLLTTTPGDVFLYRAEDGTHYQITHTPDIEEDNLRWSADGQQILYEIPDSQQITATLQDVINHSNSEISTQIAPSQNPALGDFLHSPDGSFIAGIDHSGDYSVLWTEKTDLTNRQNIADLAASATLQNDVIGWRP